MPGRARGLSSIVLHAAQCTSPGKGLAAAAAQGGLGRGWPGTGVTEKALVSAVCGSLHTG